MSQDYGDRLENGEKDNVLKISTLQILWKKKIVDAVEIFLPLDYLMSSTSCSNVSLLIALLRMLVR